jgi:predicted nucleotidyltransferase
MFIFHPHLLEKMNLTTNQINLIKDFFSRQPVLKAYLFGSYSRGEENENSDLDILVELDYTKPIGLEFIQMQLDLQKLLSAKVDLVSARGLSKYIKPILDKEKKTNLSAIN